MWCLSVWSASDVYLCLTVYSQMSHTLNCVPHYYCFKIIVIDYNKNHNGSKYFNQWDPTLSRQYAKHLTCNTTLSPHDTSML